jgi:drug/metabolite transporter (DMT)-like permease
MHRPWTAVLLLIAAQWVLSVLDASGKWLATAGGLSVLLISFVRYAVHLALTLVWVLPSEGLGVLRSNHKGLQVLRGALMLATTILFFSVLKFVPLAEATAMNFMAPVMVVAAAPWLLGERGRKSRWAGVALAFLGMLIVVRPSGAVPPLGLILGLLCATCFAAFQLVTRKLRADRERTTLLYSGLVGTAGCMMALPLFTITLPSSAFVWCVLMSTGISGFAGHLLQIAAYRRAEASYLSPFIYLQIIAAVTLGVLVFGQRPDSLSLMGMLLIVLAGLLVAWHGRTKTELVV